MPTNIWVYQKITGPDANVEYNLASIEEFDRYIATLDG